MFNNPFIVIKKENKNKNKIFFNEPPKHIPIENNQEFPSITNQKIIINEDNSKKLNYKELTLQNKQQQNILNDIKPGWIHLKFKKFTDINGKEFKPIIKEYGNITEQGFKMNEEQEQKQIKLLDEEFEKWDIERKKWIEYYDECGYILDEKQKNEMINGYCSLCSKNNYEDDANSESDSDFETFYEEKFKKNKFNEVKENE
jgi:hypothetical protein